MRIRIYNVRILTMEPGRAIFRGELHTEGGYIRYAGPEIKESRNQDGKKAITFDREIDGGGNLLLPGFKNAHTHSPMTFLRSYADDLPLKPWLHDVVFPAEARLTAEDTYWTSLLAIMEYLTSGITAVFDMYFIRDGLAKAAEDSGYRVVFCGAINDFCESAARMEEDYGRYNRQDSQGRGEGLLSFQLGFHAEYTTGGERLRQMTALADIYQAPVYMHLSETREEVASCIQRNGMSPVAYLDALGMFRYGGGGFHMVHLEEEDYEIIRKRNLTCVTNPASNMKLASGIAPIARMLREGIPVAIGTDGAASNNCLDMFREMFLVTGLAKLKEQDAAAVPAMEVLKMATVNGALTMGLTDCDVLKEGKKADFILIDLDQPNMRPVYEQSIAENLVYSGSKQNVKMTVVNGRVLYEDGHFFLGVSREEIYDRVRCIQEKIALSREKR